ncbi:MAG: hypothetical protein AAGA56_21765 [Myxococcota bacterium]
MQSVAGGRLSLAVDGHEITALTDHLPSRDVSERRLRAKTAVVLARLSPRAIRERRLRAQALGVDGSFVFASSKMQEQLEAWSSSGSVGGNIAVRGRIKRIRPDSFQMVPGIQVDVSDLGYDPFDREGFQQLERGDRVYVSGDMHSNFPAAPRIDAHWIVDLTPVAEPR